MISFIDILSLNLHEIILYLNYEQQYFHYFVIDHKYYL